jgi:hypothetical protein
MGRAKVIYNGMQMNAEWPARIEAAQEIPVYVIDGTSWDRIRYGHEEGGPFAGPCHDCGVLPGQYHVEGVCDMEECPRCHGQVIGCECPYEGDDAEPATPEERPAVPAVDWRALLKKLEPALSGYTVFLETADERLLPIPAEPMPADVVALVAAWIRDGRPLRETEAPAYRLADALRSQGLDAYVQINRRRQPSFTGFYVAIRP